MVDVFGLRHSTTGCNNSAPSTARLALFVISSHEQSLRLLQRAIQPVTAAATSVAAHVEGITRWRKNVYVSG